MAVNISARQLLDVGLVDHIRDELARFGIEPQLHRRADRDQPDRRPDTRRRGSAS
ncbi:MAG: hypothetical protein R2705_23590 [Ilumatobacteraceae bacterium]